jgi:PAS domain S-box-containing protein
VAAFDREEARMLMRLADNLAYGIMALCTHAGHGQAIEILQRSEEELREHQGHLNKAVKKRTARITKLNEQLQQEITKRKQIEEELRESEEKYKSVVDNIGIGISLIGPNMEILSLNNQMKKWFPDIDVSKRPVCYKSFNNPPRENICSYCPTYKTLKDGQVYESITDTPRGGEIRNYRIVSSPLTDKTGKIIAAIEMVEDITDQKRVGKELRESQQELTIRNRIADIFLTIPDEEMYGQVLQVVLEAVESKHGVFGYIDQNGALVCPSMTRSVWDRCKIPDKDIVFPRETWGGIWGRSLIEKKVLYSNEPSQVPEGHIPITKNMVVPVVHQGNVIGLIHVANKATDYNKRDQKLLEVIADHIAPVLHARLQRNRRDKERRLSEEALRKSEEELRRHQNHLEEMVEDRTVKLTRLNKQLQQEITERKRVEKELQHSLDKLRKIMEEIIHAMALTVEMKDPYTAGHQRKVANLACAIAREMFLSAEQVDGLRMAAAIHDIGKINVPVGILNKPCRLTETEFNLVKIHTQAGYDILKTIEFPWPIAQIVFQHHERFDGSGYPLGLSGENILIEARILCVADVVEAMCSHRPYRAFLGIDNVLKEISQNRGVLYDPRVVDTVLRLFTKKGFKFRV